MASRYVDIKTKVSSFSHLLSQKNKYFITWQLIYAFVHFKEHLFRNIAFSNVKFFTYKFLN